MNLEPTDEQRALRDTVRRHLAERADVTGHVRSMLDDATGTTARAWEGLAALGATAVLVPTDYDGLGMTMGEACIVAEELGAGLDPGPWRSSCVAAPRAVARFAAESAAAELLSAIAHGNRLATVGPLTASRVTVTEGANGTVLNGRFDVADAAAADVLLAIVSDGPDARLYAVDTAMVSVVLRRGIDDTSKVFDVALSNTPARLLGTAEPRAVTALVDDVVVISAADALGAAQRLLDTVVGYAKTRVQFGHPIGSFQSVAHLCVDMFETVELVRGGVMHAAWAADHAEPRERHLAALRLKGFATRLAAVGDTAIQVLGGIGFTWEHDAHLYLKRLLSWTVYLGSSGPAFEAIGQELATSPDDERLTRKRA